MKYGIVETRREVTYKLKTPVSDASIYFTIVGYPDIKALFFNSKEMESFQWITSLMTSFTRQLRAGIPVENIIEDMKDSFQPGGDYVIPDGSGNKVNSVVHHLGLILENHVNNNPLSEEYEL